MKFLRVVIIALCLCFGVSLAQAAEEIMSYDVDVIVDKSGDFAITETILVNVEGQNIRRGIFRDVPRYLEHQGRKVPQNIRVLSVLKDGRREMYDTEKAGNVLRIRIGNPEVLLDHREHSYQIKYAVDNQIRRDKTFDEVYWNIIGPDWNFPILKARGRITLPDGAEISGREVWTGIYGAKDGTSAKFRQDGNTTIVETTRSLAPREAMTVSIKMQKGVISGISQNARFYLWWVQNGAILLLTLSSLGVLAYYFSTWSRVGKDPAKQAVYPRYFAPKDYSPGAVAHIQSKGFPGNRALTATLVSLATKKHMVIDAGKKKTILTRQDNPQDLPQLYKDEALLLDGLFTRYTDELVLKKKYNARFFRAMQSLSTHLDKNFGKKYFRYNALYIVLGLLMSGAAVILALSQLFGNFSTVFGLVLAALIILNLIFIIIMPAPTPRGQEKRAEFEGLKLFLETAEKQKFDAVDVHGDAPPPMSIERYESLLPYAIALGVEKPWSKYFEKVMPQEAEAYDPTWSSGNYRDFGSISRMTDSLVRNISSSAQSAQLQSSGSSSSGGGGFSGGGGGGGGGGGW